MKSVKTVSLLFAIALITGCWNEQMPISPKVAQLDDSNWETLRDNPNFAMDKALEEFYEGILSAFDYKPVPKSLEEALEYGYEFPDDIDPDSIMWELMEIDTVEYIGEEIPFEEWGLNSCLR